MNEHVIDIIPTRHPDQHVEISVDADTIIEALEQALAVKRRQLHSIRVAGDYHGPSYGNPGYPSFEGFTSAQQAVDRFRERQETSGTWNLDVTDLTVRDGIIVNATETATRWPATSSEDEMDLYRVFPDEAGRQVIASGPFMRLKAGVRGGVVKERY
jgi:hypothetical protein